MSSRCFTFDLTSGAQLSPGHVPSDVPKDKALAWLIDPKTNPTTGLEVLSYQTADGVDDAVAYLEALRDTNPFIIGCPLRNNVLFGQTCQEHHFQFERRWRTLFARLREKGYVCVFFIDTCPSHLKDILTSAEANIFPYPAPVNENQ